MVCQEILKLLENIFVYRDTGKRDDIPGKNGIVGGYEFLVTQ